MAETEELTKEAIEEPAEKEAKRLPETVWAEIVALWELGETTMAELSAKYGISVTGLSKGLKRRGAVKGAKAKEMAAAVAAKVTAAAASAAAEEAVDAIEERRKRVEETRRQHYEWSVMIAKLTMAELAKAQKAGVAFGTVLNNLKALRQAEAIIANVRNERYTLLDMHGEVDEKTLPVLEIHDLNERELEELRSRDNDDDGLAIELPDETEEVVIEE